VTKAPVASLLVCYSEPAARLPAQVGSQLHSGSFLSPAKSKTRKICLFDPNFKNCGRPFF